jgi:hypothetical protein
MSMKTILRMHPLPWDYRTDQLSEGYSTIIYDANGHRPILDHLREDEAIDILSAVNARAALVEALEMVRDADEDCKRDGLKTMPPMARAKIEAALKLARAET